MNKNGKERCNTNLRKISALVLRAKTWRKRVLERDGERGGRVKQIWMDFKKQRDYNLYGKREDWTLSPPIPYTILSRAAKSPTCLCMFCCGYSCKGENIQGYVGKRVLLSLKDSSLAIIPTAKHAPFTSPSNHSLYLTPTLLLPSPPLLTVNHPT